MSKKLEGKVVVITGVNSGMGLAAAKRFAAEVAKVVITGRRPVALDAVGSGPAGRPVTPPGLHPRA